MESPPPAPSETSRILVVDDQAAIHEDFRKILATTPEAELANEASLFGAAPARAATPVFDVACASQGAEGLRLLEAAAREGRPFAVAFVDMRMPPGWDGVETILRLWQADPHLQVVICTAHSDYSWEETVARLGAGDNWVVLKKPFDNIEALQLAHALSTKWRVARRDRLHLASLDEAVQRRTAELRRSEQRFLQAFRGNPVAVSLQSLADGRYLDANPAFLQLVGRPAADVVDRLPAQLALWAGDDLWERSRRSLAENQPLRGLRGTLRTASGATREVLLSVDRIEIEDTPALLSSLQDVTERVELERQLRQSQKMEAVGQLAAGVAHDFNNVLTVIQSFTGLALAEASLPPEHQQGLRQVELAAQRAARLTRQLLLFSRRQISQPRRLDLPVCIEGFREMLRCVLPATVELHITSEPGVPPIEADEANLGQVLMNLVVNARDALPGGVGRIAISTRAVTRAEDAPRPAPGARPGRFVCLSVADDGCGIEPALLPRIFEPFFTTKPVGQGTGLGLSTVYGIVQQHQGWMEVSSQPGRGATFQLYLPALDTGAPAPAAAPETAPAHRGRGERLLLVEDELPVRTATRLIASRFGYTVIEAADAVAALDLAAAGQPFDLLITDMVMPHGLNGVDLAHRLRRTRPHLPVILTTGYSQQLMAQPTASLEGASLLLKPYSAHDLLTTLRKLLDPPAPTPEPAPAA